MPFIITASDQFVENQLGKSGNRAGKEACLFSVIFQKVFRKYHEADPYGRSDRTGKGTDINNVVPVRKGEQGVCRLSGESEFAVIVIFNEVGVSAVCPGNIFPPFGYIRRNSGRVAVKWCDVQYICAAAVQLMRQDAVFSELQFFQSGPFA